MLFVCTHYENKPVPCTAIFHGRKNGLCFREKNKKKMYTTLIPSFTLLLVRTTYLLEASCCFDEKPHSLYSAENIKNIIIILL